ncbi:MAG: deoxyribose-phosphate aldolase [Actinomyces dentalis]
MSATPLTDRIVEIRARAPERIARALADRPRGSLPEGDGGLMIIACDHPARGALAAGGRAMAMASREDVLSRCVTALGRPGVNGFLGTADLIEDLALLGALDGKLVYGSMNRGGLAGAAFEMDDRFTGYDARGIVDAGLDGGKMLLRIDYEDPRTADTLAACAAAVDDLAERGLMAMVEPFICRRRDGRVVNDLSADAVIASMAIASGLGRTSARTWLKLPAVADMERVMEASTLPALILGGAVSADADAARASWARALALPTVRGLVIGRSLLFPPDDDVAGAVDNTVGLLS